MPDGDGDGGDGSGVQHTGLMHARLARGMKATGSVAQEQERLAEEQEAALEAVRNRRDGPHKDTAAHRRWAKTHFCPRCAEEWERQGRPGEVSNSDGELGSEFKGVYD